MKGYRAVAVLVGLLLGAGAAVAAPDAGVFGGGPIYYTTYDLEVDVTGPGLVSGGNPDHPGNSIYCHGTQNPPQEDCHNEYQENRHVTLFADPDPGQQFLGWGGDCVGFGTNPTCQLHMTEDKVATATFGQPTQPVAKQAKGLFLQARPKKVQRRDPTNLTATISPCNVQTQNDTIRFLRGGATIAELPVSSTCQAELRRRVRRTTTFSAFSPADGDSDAATSNSQRVRVKKKKS